MGKRDIDISIVLKALEESQWLISDEYSAVINDDIKQKYEEVLETINKALKEIRDKQ